MHLYFWHGGKYSKVKDIEQFYVFKWQEEFSDMPKFS